ncbi:MAG TPA: hypothetical protein VGM44_07675 [Polyangiaceae bacterium]|jgi:hypothetical protein
MKQALVGGLGFCLVCVVACGGTSDSGGSGIMTIGGSAGSAGNAGSSFTPLGSGGGGTGGSGGSTSTSSAGSGGNTGGTSSGGSGGLPFSSPGYPMGMVEQCAGSGCPMGQCDDDMFISQTPCSSVYTAPIGPNSTYCNPGESGSYCVEASIPPPGSNLNPGFAVACVSGSATVLQCNHGCGSEAGQFMCMNNF